MLTPSLRLAWLLLCGCSLACSAEEDPAPPPVLVVGIAAGDQHTCALFDDGSVKCWGAAAHGRLGNGDVNNLGDDPGEMGSALPRVDLGSGRRAVAIAAGGGHTCAILDDATMKCWGSGYAGRNGQGNEYDHVGDEAGEMGDALPPIDLGAGRLFKAVSSGFAHNCALFDDGSAKCWGHNAFAQLGTGTLLNSGDQPGELGDVLPPLDLGSDRTALAVAAAPDFSCALLDDASIKCWGTAPNGYFGGEPGQMGDALPPVDLGAGVRASSIATGGAHSCALLEDNGLKCWGANPLGQLGLGDTTDRRAASDPVDVGPGTVAAVSAGGNHTCVLFSEGTVKCFGGSLYGVLGQGSDIPQTSGTAHLGDEPLEMGAQLPDVDLGSGKVALAISAGTRHTCALLEDHSVKCWGNAADGQLGLGDSETRGDDPDEMGDALPAIDL